MTSNKKINWTPVIITVLVTAGIYGGYLLVKTWKAGEEERHKEAERILEEYDFERIELQDWIERIFAGGRTPTDEEMSVLDAMIKQMELKEKIVYELSRSTFDNLHNLLADAASKWWLVPVEIASIILIPIAGYMTYKFIREWFNRRPPGPPKFECPNCYELFYTKEALKEHQRTQHPPTTQQLAATEELFRGASVWIKGAVAVESGLYKKIEGSWWKLSMSEISELAWAATTGTCYGIAGVAGMTTLRMLPILLLI